MSDPALSSPDGEPCALFALPRLVLSQLLCHLELREQLRIATCNKYLSSVVCQDVLPCTQDLDLLLCSGAQTAAALQWLCGCSGVQSLRRLAVQGAISDDAYTCLDQTGRHQLGTLHSLILQGWKRLDTPKLITLVVHCHSLTSLEFSNCKVDDAGLAALAESVPTLRQLNCSHCLRITDDGIRRLVLGAKLLKGLVLDGVIHCSDQTLAMLAMHAANLEHLSLAKCLKIRNAGVKALASAPGPEGLAPGSSLSGATPLLADALRSLCLSWCPKVSVIDPLAALRQLESLDLTGCKDVQDMQLVAAVSGSADSMRRLYLHGCASLTGEGIVAVTAACKRLEVLSLRNIPVQDDQLHQLAAHTGHLTDLGLNMCHAITDTGLCPLLAANTGLEKLELEACYLLTDATIRLLPFTAPRLASVNLRLCNLVTSRALLEMVCGTQNRGPERNQDNEAGLSHSPTSRGTDTGRQAELELQTGTGPCVSRSDPVVAGGGVKGASPGCRRLHTMRLGGVLSEAETTMLVRQLKVSRPSIVLRV